MTIAGIIAEYNPFHNGHAYHIAETKRLTGCDYVVVVMSGNFVQRGVPAAFDRYQRAEWAAKCGADLVIELPPVYATSSAEGFAYGGVKLLSRLGCDFLSFGVDGALANSGVGDTLAAPLVSHFEQERFEQLAAMLANEPEEYKALLRKGLASGLSFPVARKQAVDVLLPECAAFLDTPNNILALEYLKAIRTLSTSMKPIMIPRVGAGYHEEGISEFSSASGIRAVLQEEMLTQNSGKEHPFLYTSIPEAIRGDFRMTVEAMKNHHGHLPTENDYSDVLFARLSSLSENTVFQDISEDLLRRILTASKRANYEFSELAEVVKAKSLTRTHVNRALLHILLEMNSAMTSPWFSEDAPFYLHVLACRKEASHLLGDLSNTSGIPFLTRAARDVALLSSEARTHFDFEARANALYARMYGKATGIAIPTEYTRKFQLI